MKLWQKNTDANQAVDRFTVGHDREMDLFLAEADVLGSLAHTRMLNSIGLLGDEDLQAVQRELKKIHADIVAGRFTIDEGIEDVHSQVEFLLTERIGDAGKKIHSGRSRNDQVLVDLRIFLRRQIKEIVEDVESLFRLLQSLSDKYNEVLMPGYTHTQQARSGCGSALTPKASWTTPKCCMPPTAFATKTRSAQRPVTARRSRSTAR